MQKLNLCIDIDGTVTEPFYWLNRANKFFGKQVKPEDVSVYEIHRVLDIAEDDYNEFYDLYGQLLHKEAEARFGASEVLKRLYDHHNIHFVTAREGVMKDVSVAWLEKHEMPMDSIWLLGSHYKVDQARELKSDLFIEDNYSNALQLAKAGFDVLLIDCSYNKGNLPHNVTRVKNWFQIKTLVEIRAQRNELDFKIAL